MYVIMYANPGQPVKLSVFTASSSSLRASITTGSVNLIVESGDNAPAIMYGNASTFSLMYDVSGIGMVHGGWTFKNKELVF